MKNKYQLRIFRTGGTAQVFAFGNNDSCMMLQETPNNDNTPSKYQVITTNAFKFHHNPVDQALKPYNNEHPKTDSMPSYEDSVLSDEDYFVDFESSTSLQNFKMQLQDSDFNEHSKFNTFHNCADAANFALSNINMIDIYQMTTPSEENGYLDLHTNPSYLYLYRDNDQRIYFKLHGESCYLPDSISALAKDAFFNSHPDNLFKSNNKAFCEAVLAYTSEQGYTNKNFKTDLKNRYSRFNETTFCRFPYISTPYELFLSAKEFKIQQLEDYRYPFKLELAKKALEFRIRTNQDKTFSENAKKIISETDKRLETHFHHADFYLKLLIDTNDMIIQSLKDSSDTSMDTYRQSAAFFKNRGPCNLKRSVDQAIALSIFAFVGTLMMTYYTSYKVVQLSFLEDSSWLFKTAAFLGSNCLISKMITGLSNYLRPYTMSRFEKRNQEEITACHTTVDTALSQTITDLSDQFEKNALTCKK